MKPETQRWLEIAEGNMDMSEAGLERGRYGLCVFHCHQAIEMILKALIAESRDPPLPPKIHGLLALARQANGHLSDEQRRFLGRLSRQYIPTRYGGMALEYSREDAENYYAQTKDLFGWLQQQLS